MNGASETKAKLALGPLLFNWPSGERRDFYFRIADEAPIDTVYVGEVVCQKRAVFLEPVFAEIVERLTRAGKEVVLSTLALVMTDEERAALRATAAESELLVEANDIAAVAALSGRPHVIGPFVNAYNEGALDALFARGAQWVSLPAELSAEAIATLAAHAGGARLEVQAFGRLPLALSARCYHARIHGLHKDGCRYVCGENPNGLDLETLDGEPFLAVNGTQTMTYTVCNLIGALDALAALGVGRVRLWPQAVDMVAVAEAFRSVLDGREEAEAAAARLEDLVGFAPFAAGFYEGREGAAGALPFAFRAE